MGIENEEVGGGGTADVTGGVGNGQATGTGQMPEGFDVGSAVESIGSDLGFTKSSAEDPPVKAEPVAEAPKPAPAVADPALTPPAAKEPAAAEPMPAPKTWKPEEAAVWAAIPDAAKAAIARREEDMFRGIEQYKVAANFGHSVNEILRPYEAILREQNVNPVQLMQNLMSAQYQLATGSPAQKVSMFQSLMKDYGIDPASLGATAAEETYVDPEVSRLRAELEQVKSGQTQLSQARQRDDYAKAQNDVHAFATDPANVHFDEVADEMTRLLRMDKSMPLSKAYETAVWSNPAVRAKEIARQDAEKQSRSTAEATQRAEQARAATAANVRVQPKVGAATLPVGTMDDTMEATLRAIKSRT